MMIIIIVMLRVMVMTMIIMIRVMIMKIIKTMLIMINVLTISVNCSFYFHHFDQNLIVLSFSIISIDNESFYLFPSFRSIINRSFLFQWTSSHSKT